MNRDQRYSIGQAAKICNISIQTLRYYNKIGLVKPGYTDKFTGYRYYSNFDVLYIKIVQDMKSLNFSLEEIKAAMKDDSLDNLLTKLEFKHRQTVTEIRQLEQIAASIAHRKGQILDLKELSSGLKELDVLVELKSYPARQVLSDRRRSASGMDASIVRFTELYHKAEANGLTPGRLMTIYHENIMTFDRTDAELEYCISVDFPENQAPDEDLGVIPAGEYITALYCGIPNEESCKRIYGKLLEWMDRNHYREVGPAIEQYFVDMAQMIKPEEFIVELQVPVKKD
ncbi:MerR family transcriptional regulator [Paenibacillus caui]|uniref:MerR family transcriptional regulator n=1 Tax=Paenibacillus caui TaxID=2873927 RepID=UPI001CAA25D9|nr:MerR family transcriptional regulator [Paenibacillus caui]